jgi:hypothetical protein
MENLKLKRNISLFILLFINLIFSIKYISRYNDNYLVISLFLILSQFIITVYSQKISSLLSSIKIKPIYLLYFFCLFLLLVAYKIPLESLKIDRWSVITSFWDNYFNNLYVYKAKSFDGNYPGPMPFYFIIMLPFYLIKEFSYVTVLGILFFFYLLKSEQSRMTYICLIILSIPIAYEIVSRSNIFFNSFLVLFSLKYFIEKQDNLILKSILIGLLLSTRNVFIIIYGIVFLYSLIHKKNSFVNLIKIGLYSLLIFILTFIPFVYNHINEFWQINPFKIQSSALLPFNYSLFCIIISVCLGYFIQKKEDVYFLSGISLFITIIIYFIYWSINKGFYIAFWGSYADITYFIFCIPFLIYYYLETKNPDENRD